jgi:hypothetical protein
MSLVHAHSFVGGGALQSPDGGSDLSKLKSLDMNMSKITEDPSPFAICLIDLSNFLSAAGNSFVYMKMPSSGMLTRCGSCKNQRLVEPYRLHHQGDKNRRARNNLSHNFQLAMQRASGASYC